jgi:LuxR family maltose regulon positive regulatory protein
MQLAKETGLLILAPALFAHGVYIFLNAGDTTTAKLFLTDLEKTISHDRRLHAAHYYHIAAWYHQCIDDFQQAVVLGKKALEFIQEAGAPFPGAYTRLGLALALYEIGDTAEALKHLGDASKMSSQTGSQYLKYLTLLAKAHFALDASEDVGISDVKEALRCGRQNDYTPLVNFWRPLIVTRICRKALEHGIEKEYVLRLIQNLSLVPDIRFCAADKWPWEIRITTFNDFRIALAGKPLQFSSKAPRKLLAVMKALIACGPNGASEEQLSDMLWPESGGDTALQSLDTNLHRLRQLLKNDKAIQLREGRVRFDPQRCWIDAHAFEDILAQTEEFLGPLGAAHTPKHSEICEGLRLVEQAVRIYSGPFLEKATEPWALAYRERLRTKYLKAVQRLGQYYEHSGLLERAIAWYEKGLEVDDIAEPFYQSLIKCYRNMGRTAEAISLYQRCKRTLQAVLKIGPSPETEALFKTLNG